MKTNRTILATLALLPCIVGRLSAQTNFNEVEPNGAKADATIVAGMASGDRLVGVSTGADATPGNGSIGTADTFRVATALAPAAIYSYQLVLATSGAVGHTLTIRAENQFGGSPDPNSDVAAQTSSSTTSPPRFLRWYGFGRAEKVYVRIAGTVSTTGQYQATLTRTTITPVLAPVTRRSGMITISCVGQTTVNTDLWLYDSTLHPITAAGNDDSAPSGSLQSTLTRPLNAGTYYLAISATDLANDQVAAFDDANQNGKVLDFPDAIVTSTSALQQSLNVLVTDATGPLPIVLTKQNPYEIVWLRFTVVDLGPAFSFCDAGMGGVIACPCANPPATFGLGCDNSGSTGGASLSASGAAALSADTLLFTSAAEKATATSILLQGDAPIGAGVVFGQGVRCVGGTLKRLYVTTAVGGAINVPTLSDPSVSSRSAALGDTIFAGTHRSYMVYYRDPIVLGGCPALSTFNGTQALDVAWAP